MAQQGQQMQSEDDIVREIAGGAGIDNELRDLGIGAGELSNRPIGVDEALLSSAGVGEREDSVLFSPPMVDQERDTDVMRAADERRLARSKDNSGKNADLAELEQRRAYEQSRADKALRAVQTMERELALARQIQQAVLSDENLTQAVRAKLRGDTQSREPELTPPTAPEKPAGYNDQEAFSNPQSDSYKFRLAHEAYLLNRIAFNEQKLERAERRNAEREQRFQEEQERMAQASQTERYLITKRGFRPEEAREVVEEMLNSEGMTVDDYAELYRIKRTNSRRNNDRRDGGIPPMIVGGGSRNGGVRRSGGLSGDPNADFNAIFFGPPTRR